MKKLNYLFALPMFFIMVTLITFAMANFQPNLISTFFLCMAPVALFTDLFFFVILDACIASNDKNSVKPRY
jgi:hypothetical protein